MDLKKVQELLDLMETHGLDEIEVEQDGVRVRLKKAGQPPMIAAYAPPPAAVAHAPVLTGAPAAPTPAAEDGSLARITSPMVGTFYRSPSPDADPFVNPGDTVGPDQVVCIIEAMKVMNEIKAEVEGEIVSILVENGESVEYGQPIMTIRRSGTPK